MKRIDVFNGDADGICALHQWRLAHPADSQLVTGVKRDIRLLSRLSAQAGDSVTVFDISFDSNRTEALSLLDTGVSLRWFDHHFAGDAVSHPGLEALIDTAPDVCTSLLVDRTLNGRYRTWAIAAAFGDNLHDTARNTAAGLSLTDSQVAALVELGELLNYNGYGDSPADLHFAPEDLYRQIAAYIDPFDFIADCDAFRQLRSGFAEDIQSAESLKPCLAQANAAAWLLPDAAWARRVIGVMANRLATASPDRAHALLVPNASGALTVSVRAPINRPVGADELCRRYPTGGGRKAAAGVNNLPRTSTDDFLGAFSSHFTA